MKIDDITRKISLAFGYLLLIFAPFLTYFPMSVDNDVFWQVKSGEIMWNTGKVLSHDVFTYVSNGQFWFNQHWLADIIFFLFSKLLPIYKFVVISNIVTVLVYVFILLTIRLLDDKPRFWLVAVVVFPYFMILRQWLYPRPFIFSVLFFAIILYLLTGFYIKRDIRFLYPLPFIFLIWANMHLLFVIGIIVVLCFALFIGSENKFMHRNFNVTKDFSLRRNDKITRSVISTKEKSNLKFDEVLKGLYFIIFVSFALTFVNPYFHEIYIRSLFFANKANFGIDIDEWVSLSKYIFGLNFFLLVFYFSSYLIFIPAFFLSINNLMHRNFNDVFSFREIPKQVRDDAGECHAELVSASNLKRKNGAWYFFLLLFSSCLLIQAVRYINIWAVAVCPIVYFYLSSILDYGFFERFKFSKIPKFFLKYFLLITYIFLLIYQYFLPNYKSAYKELMTFPVSTLEFMKAKRCKGNIFTDVNWGGTASYYLYPDCKVSADTRFDFFENKYFWFYYNTFIGKIPFEYFFEKYPTDFVLISRDMYKDSMENWLVYADNSSVLYCVNKELINKYNFITLKGIDIKNVSLSYDLTENQLTKLKITLEEYIKITPDNSFLSNILAQIYIQNKDYEGALEVLESSLKIIPWDFKNCLLLMKINRACFGNFQRVEELAKFCLKYSGDSGVRESSFLMLSDINYEEKNYVESEKALINYFKIVKTGGEFDAYFRMGNLFFLKEKYDKALEYYEKAYYLSSDLSQKGTSCFYTAEVYSQIGKMEEAFAFYLKSYEISGNLLALYNFLRLNVNVEIYKINEIKNKFKEIKIENLSPADREYYLKIVELIKS